MFSTLDYFYAVAQYKNFTTAADKINISQSALSKAVKKLEEQLNCTLFIRSRDGVQLTQAGEILFDCAAKNKSIISETLDKIEHLNAETSECMNIASGDGLFAYYMIPLLQKFRFQEKFPRVVVRETETLNSAQIIQQIDKLNITFGLVNRKPDNVLFDYFQIAELHDVVLAGPKYAFLADHGCVDNKALAPYPFIVRPTGTYTRTRFDSFFHEQGIVPTVTGESGNTGIMLQMAAADLGLAVVQREMAESFEIYKKLQVIHLTTPFPPSACYITWRKNRTLPVCAQELIEYIRSNDGETV